jgi:hypothetical protein
MTHAQLRTVNFPVFLCDIRFLPNLLNEQFL